ncbi:hypothetical protein [Brevundimonas faecalis]|uniref:Uncharacterized protein (TIGR02588 family) n=1 Tax=Brevundimonas faecalis TaxID=947378 RepID=A0ABV2R9L2_9CAUL
MTPRRDTTSRLQCLCALAGFITTLAAGVVLARAAFSAPSPPELIIQAESMHPSSAGWVVEVVVVNQGDLAAAAVEIEGEASGERAGATLDYVPGGGEKKAGLVFATRDRPEPRLRILGWSSP